MGRRRREVGVAGLLKFQDILAWKNKSSSNHSYFPILPFSLFVFLKFSSVLDEGSYDLIVGGTKNTNFQNSMGALSNPISFALRISKQFSFLF